MSNNIQISKKAPRKRGEDGHKVLSVRLKDRTIVKLDELSAKTNRSRNELINILLEEALNNVIVTDEDMEKTT